MKKLLWLLGILGWNTLAFAQNPVFKMLRYDENWTLLKKDTGNNWYNHLKYSSIGNSNKSYISVGGEVRFQYFAIKRRLGRYSCRQRRLCFNSLFSAYRLSY